MPNRPLDPTDFPNWANDIGARLRAVERRILNKEELELLQTLDNGSPLGDTLFLDFKGLKATLVGDRFVEVTGGGKRFATIVVAAADSELRGDGVDFVCTGTADELTLDEAVAALPAAGGKILLLEGTYNLTGSWIVSSLGPVHIQGMGAGTVLTNSTGNYCVSNFAAEFSSVSWLRVLDSEYGIESGTGRGLIHGCVVETSSGYSGAGETAISSTGQGTRISDCYVLDRGEKYDIGISSQGSDTYIGNCIIEDLGGGGVSDAALYVSGSRTVVANVAIWAPGGTNAVRLGGGQSVRLVNVIVEDPAGTGFLINGSAGSSLIGCRVHGAGSRGISCTVSEAQIIGCLITDAGAGGGEGMLFTGSNCTVQGNVIEDSSFEAIKNSGSDSRFIGNVIDGAGEEGIENTGGHVAIIGNLIRAAKHGIYISSTDDGVIQGNTIRSSGYDTTNTYDGIHLTSADRWNVQGNTVRGADTRYGISVNNAASDDNLVTNNDLLNSGATGSLNDAGTGTITAAGNRL